MFMIHKYQNYVKIHKHVKTVHECMKTANEKPRARLVKKTCMSCSTKQVVQTDLVGRIFCMDVLGRLVVREVTP